MRRDNRAADHVMPVFSVIFAGVDIAAVKGTDIALVAHLRKLLTNIVGREHFSGRAGNASGEIGSNIASLCIGDGAQRRGGGLSGKEGAYAERQGCHAVAQCGEHRKSLQQSKKIDALSMKLWFSLHNFKSS